MSFKLMFPVRCIQVVMALVLMALSAYVANWYNMSTMTSSPSPINFLIFVSVWTFFSVAYLEGVPRFAPKLSLPIVAFVVEVLNVVFYFAGFVALAVFLSKLLFCRGSVCGAARASVAFASFEFCLWALSAVILARDLFKGGLRRSKPAAAPNGAFPAMKETSAA